MYHVLIRAEVRYLKNYLRFMLKMRNCVVAVLLIQCIITLKVICDEEPSIVLQNVKKPAGKFSFIRGYRVAVCSFTKSITPSKMSLHGLQ